MFRASLPFALCLLLAAPAGAQQFDIQAAPNGFSMHANVPPDMPAANAQVTTTSTSVSTSTVESSSEGYRLNFAPNAHRATLMRVLSPEGALCQVWEGKKLIAEDDVPMSFKAKGDQYYRFVIKLANGMVWEKKLASKRGHTGSLWVAAPAIDAQLVVNAPPAQPMPPPQQAHVIVHEVHHHPPPVPAGPMPMADRDFKALKGAIAAEDFSSEKLQVLQTATGAAWFTINQVGQLVDLFDFGSDKVQSVRIVSSHIVDRQNAFQLYSHFKFSSEKSQVRQILGQ